MPKVTIPPVGNPENSSFVTKLNEAINKLSGEFEKVVYRDGSLDIDGPIDMGSNRLYNLPAPLTEAEPLRQLDIPWALRGEQGLQGPPGDVGKAADRAALAGLVGPTAGSVRQLLESGREGLFVFASGDLSSQVAADTLQGIYVAPNATPSGASGAWVRVVHGGIGFPEWFGNDYAALDAAYRHPSITTLILKGKDYFIGTNTLKLNLKFKHVRGVGGVAYDGTQGTRIVSSSPSNTIIQFGPDTNPGGDPGVTFMRGSSLIGVQATRDAVLVPAATIVGSPTGISIQYVYDCTVDAYSWESSIGARVKGAVDSRIKITSLRSTNATTTVNDVAIGTYLDGTEDIGLAGGNASILVSSTATIVNSVTAPVKKGIYGLGKLADLTIEHAETVGAIEAIHLKATGDAANNVDIRILSFTGDQPSGKAMVLEDFPLGSQVDVFSPYGGTPSTASRGIELLNSAGNITFHGGQYIGFTGGSTFGFRALNSSNFILDGTKFLNYPNPVELDGCSNFEVRPMVSNPTTTGTYAVSLTGTCTRGKVAPIVSGGAAVMAAAAVMLFTDAISEIDIDLTRIDPAAISGGRRLMLGATNVTITTRGRFLGNGTPSATGTIRVEGLPETDVLLPAGKVVKIDGTQVLGARQTGTAPVATDLATALTLVNDLRAKLITHGIIS